MAMTIGQLRPVNVWAGPAVKSLRLEGTLSESVRVWRDYQTPSDRKAILAQIKKYEDDGEYDEARQYMKGYLVTCGGALDVWTSTLYVEGVAGGEAVLELVGVVQEGGDSDSGAVSDSVVVHVSNVAITNKDDLMYVYPAWIINRSPFLRRPVIKTSARPGTCIEWSVEIVTARGVQVRGIGPDNITAELTVTDMTDRLGTFFVRVSDDEANVLDEVKCLVVGHELKNAVSEPHVYAVELMHDEVASLMHASTHALNEWKDEEVYRDAKTHLYWMAIVTADPRYGRKMAELLGNAHEFLSFVGSGVMGAQGNDARNVSQDLHNNHIGRAIGMRFRWKKKWWSNEELQNEIAAAVNEVVSHGIDPREEMDMDPEVPHYKVRLW